MMTQRRFAGYLTLVLSIQAACSMSFKSGKDAEPVQGAPTGKTIALQIQEATGSDTVPDALRHEIVSVYRKSGLFTEVRTEPPADILAEVAIGLRRESSLVPLHVLTVGVIPRSDADAYTVYTTYRDDYDASLLASSNQEGRVTTITSWLVLPVGSRASSANDLVADLTWRSIEDARKAGAF